MKSEIVTIQMKAIKQYFPLDAIYCTVHTSYPIVLSGIP